jgi:hypothetical protein
MTTHLRIAALAAVVGCSGVHEYGPGTGTPAPTTPTPPAGGAVTPPGGLIEPPPPGMSTPGTPTTMPPPAGTMPPTTGNEPGTSSDGGVPVVAPPMMPTTTLPAGGPFAMGATPDKVIAFVHIGHSNMAGRATQPASLHPYFYDVDPKLWSFHGADMILGKPPWTWRAAKEPLSPDATTGSMAGPGMAILHAAQTLNPDLFFTSTGHGHSGEMGGYCSNYRKGGLLYEIAMAPARQLRGHVTWGGIFTMLGTTERHLDTATQMVFADCMAHVAADMRADLGDPNIPFMMSDFEMTATGDTSPNLPYAKIIIAQLRIAVMNIPRSALIPTDMLPIEGSHHFTMAGHKEWALRGMQIMKQKGFAPWAK